MKELRPMQPWISLWSNATLPSQMIPITQDAEEIFCTDGYEWAGIQADILSATNCTLVLQGTNDPKGQWYDMPMTENGVAVTIGEPMLFLSKDAADAASFSSPTIGQSDPLYRYLRWSIETQANWEMTFRLFISIV